MVYPARLLPHPTHSCIDFDTISQTSLVLVRHTEMQEIQDEYGNLKAEAVDFRQFTDNLRDYSTNLLGAFTLTDIGWKWLTPSPFIEYWQPGEPIVQPTFPNDVSWTTGRGAFFLIVPTFFRAAFQVVTPTGTEKATCMVLHTPTRGNFWHCSIRWFVDENNVANWSEKPRKRILKEARNFIIKNAQFVQPPYEAVPESAYKMG